MARLRSTGVDTGGSAGVARRVLRLLLCAAPVLFALWPLPAATPSARAADPPECRTLTLADLSFTMHQESRVTGGIRDPRRAAGAAEQRLKANPAVIARGRAGVTTLGARSAPGAAGAAPR